MARGKPKQARRPDVPPADHVARHCNPQRVIRHPVTRQVQGVWPEAFELRVTKNGEYLSVHWMEYFSTDIDPQFRKVVKALRKKRDVVPNFAIARLNVGLIVQAGSLRGHSLVTVLQPAIPATREFMACRATT
jgi:hypothetical protein